LSVVRGDSGNDVRQNVDQDRTTPQRNAAEDLRANRPRDATGSSKKVISQQLATTKTESSRTAYPLPDPHESRERGLHAQLILSPVTLSLTLTCRRRGDFDFPSPQMTELFITIPMRPRPKDDRWHKLGKNSAEWAIHCDLWHKHFTPKALHSKVRGRAAHPGFASNQDPNPNGVLQSSWSALV
jgi:hypothetical protein